MVFRWFLPKDGGGQIRRYLKFRKTMLNRMAFTKDTRPFPPITLFDFTEHHDAVDAAKVGERDNDCWRISSDKVIGGFSESFASLQQSTTNGGAERPFLHWTGTLDTTVGLRSTAQRSGFAALRSPIFPLDGANLQGLYSCLEITCRSDGRLYTVNLKVSSPIPDDIYQGHIQATKVDFRDDGTLDGDFDTLVLPFEDFRLTSMGREREVLRVLDSKVRIESIGVALMDGKNGDFQFDLARIRAVNMYKGKIYEGEPSEEDAS